jgi:3-methylcrotonyl-CoA carboxylase alpha subunit
MPLLSERSPDPWVALRGFRSNAEPDGRMVLEVGGVRHVAVPSAGNGVTAGGERVLFVEGQSWSFGPPITGHAVGTAIGDGALVAPMPGDIVSVIATAGAAVTKGQRLVVMEVMKMELALTAPFDGIVEAVKVKVGDQVAEGTLPVLVRSGN